jgi:hypothetical protein
MSDTRTPSSSTATGHVDTAATRAVLRELLGERRNQVIRHGWDPEHDDAHGPDQFAWLIGRRAVEMCNPAALGALDVRRLLVECAAIAVAAIESYDRVHPTAIRLAEDEDL